MIEYKITEGESYYWPCFGSNSRIIDYRSQDRVNEVSASLVFDSVDQTCYQAEVYDYSTDNFYRWTHPEFVDRYKAECAARNIEFSQAFDDKEFVDLEVADDFLEKGSAIVRGLPYDERISIPVDIPEDVLFELMKAAHQKDITFNQFMAEIIKNECDNILAQEVK